MRPELCPLGKYGFDVRCRGWYDMGKKNALSKNGTLHITAPYIFAGGTEITGQSTTSPVMQGEEYIGQTIVGKYAFLISNKSLCSYHTDNILFCIVILIPNIDFIPGSIFQSMAKESKKLGNGAFTFLITPQRDGELVITLLFIGLCLYI